MCKNTTCSILEHTALDGKHTETLKEYLVRGYAINEKRLLEAREKFQEVKNVIGFLQEKSKKKLLVGQEKEILNLISD